MGLSAYFFVLCKTRRKTLSTTFHICHETYNKHATNYVFKMNIIPLCYVQD